MADERVLSLAERANRKLIKMIETMSYEEFSKKFKNQKEMYQMLMKSINVVRSDLAYQGDRTMLFDRLPEFSRYEQTNDEYVENVNDMYGNGEQFGFRDVYAYETFNMMNEELKNNKTRSKDFGKEAFINLKKSFMHADSMMLGHRIKASGITTKYAAKTEFVDKAKKDIDTMLKLLESGDSCVRGSSKEYKDIQNELKQLKESLKQGNERSHRNLVISMQAISDKAAKYVENRADVLEKHSMTGYKGKRVSIMNMVNARLDAIIDYVENVAEVKYGAEAVRQSAEDQAKGFEKNAFSLSRLMNIRASVSGRERAAIDERTAKALEDMFSGRKVSFTKAHKVLNELERFHSQLDNAKSEADVVAIRQMFRKPVKNENLAFLDNMVYETNYEGKLTGDYNIDMDVKKYENEMMTKLSSDLREANKQDNIIAI